MADAVTVQPLEDIKPQMPNAVKIQPGSVAPAPNIAASQPADVAGGAASFSDVTDAIEAFKNAKIAELDASQKALIANTQVDQNTSKAVAGYTQQTLDAFTNIQKAEQLPGGVGGKLSKIFGLFDRDYNVDLQKTAVEENQLRAKLVSDTAAAIKEQNNALPTILGKIAEGANAVFQAQRDANQLALNKQTLTDRQMQTKIEAARLGIDMSQERRAAAEFKIKSMTTAQLTAALPQAQAGKGPLAGLGGLIEDHLTSELSAQTSLETAQLALKKGNRQEYEDASANFVSHIPVDLTKQLYDKAMAAGAPLVSFPTGKDKDGNVTTTDVPIDIVQKGMTLNLETQTKTNAALAADISEKNDLMPTITNLSNTAAAFAGVDPQATSIMTQLASVLHNTDVKNPQAVSQLSILVKGFQTKMDAVVKQQADKYVTSDAKAAIISYGKNAKFDAVGGTAVAAATVGVPSVNTHSLYKDAWTEYSTLVATQVKAEHNSSSAALGAADTNADAMQILATMTQQNQGRERLSTIAQNVLADPAKAKSIGLKINQAAQSKIFNDVFLGLGSGKAGNPVFKDMYDHSEQIVNKNNQIDFGLMMDKLEAATVRSGGKINYAAAFLKGTQNYGANAENNSTSDPSYTMQDHALEASIYGANPYRAISADIYRRSAAAAAKAHKEMQQRINDDISGKTKRDAIMRADPFFEPQPGMGWNDTDAILKHTGVNLATVPSATGTGLTADQVAQMYGGK